MFGFHLGLSQNVVLRTGTREGRSISSVMRLKKINTCMLENQHVDANMASHGEFDNVLMAWVREVLYQAASKPLLVY